MFHVRLSNFSLVWSEFPYGPILDGTDTSCKGQVTVNSVLNNVCRFQMLIPGAICMTALL